MCPLFAIIWSMLSGLNPGVGNRPVITYAHLSQVDWIAKSGVKGDAYPVHPLERTQLVKITVREFLDDIGMFAVTSHLGLVGREATTVTPF